MLMRSNYIMLNNYIIYDGIANLNVKLDDVLVLKI